MTILEAPIRPDAARSIPKMSSRRRLMQWMCERPQSRHEVAARISAHVYGNVTALGAMLALVPGSAVSSVGAIVVLAACLSTFLAHAFSDLLSRGVGHDHYSMFTAAASAVRDSVPIVSAAVVPLALLTVGAWVGWPESSTQLAAQLFICVRIGMIGALAERLRGRASSRRLVLLGVSIAVAAGVVAVVKLILI